MKRPRSADPVGGLLAGLLASVCALAAPASAAELNPAPGGIGQPIVLFSPNSPDVTTPAAQSVAAAQPPHVAATLPPIKRPNPTLPVQVKPLIPPAPMPAKLGPPPDPRPGLSLETDLQPLAPTSQAPPAGTASPPAGKPPAG